MKTVFNYSGGQGTGYSIEAMHCYLSKPFKKEVNFWEKHLPPKGWMMFLDDLHGDPKWNLSELLTVLEKKNIVPDGIYSETAFVPLANVLLNFLQVGGFVKWYPGSHGQELRWKNNGHSILLGRKGYGGIRPSCALLTSAWTLCRLGYLSAPEGVTLYGRPFSSVESTQTWLRNEADISAEENVQILLSVLAPNVKVDVQLI